MIKWATSRDARLQIAFIETAFGKAPQAVQVDIRGYEQRQAEDFNKRRQLYLEAMQRQGEDVLIDVEARVIPNAAQLGDGKDNGDNVAGLGGTMDSRKSMDNPEVRPTGDTVPVEFRAETVPQGQGGCDPGGQAADVSGAEIPAGWNHNAGAGAVILPDNAKP